MAELIIYILIAVITAVKSRHLSGQDNGVFYAKGLWKGTGGTKLHPNEPDLQKLIVPVYQNFHRNETPTWYMTYGRFFIMLLALFRAYRGLEYSFLDIALPVIAACLISMGASAMGGVKYQGYINVGSGLPFLDKTEKSASEFAWGKFSYWWKRPFSGGGRKTASILGAAAVLAGLFLGFIKW